ncbi:hypothetical protein [Microbacterium paraoxydans]|uniref:DUF4232 domain-containing protein n=1 Tax=Microbacterium paraoxydans TaxID=199592 RepID=A0ABS5IM33_9MICO|nr:hypothetical protein [Microbacterium paraoxydans]MBS0023998.1 hypothetical protein [Microbacterium paraoxydans]
MPRRSAAVYRRRRLVVLLGLILVLAVIGVSVWLLVARPWAAATDATPAPTSTATSGATPPATGSASPEPTPSASETPGVVACQAKDIEVTAVTDADTYPAGVNPQLSISLTNKGTTDCTIDVGSSTQVFMVSSGADVWWRSTDCQENPSSMIATLTAGSTVVSKEPVVWDRTRSSVETCAQENRQRAPGGGASYHVAVSIGGFPSAGTTQFLLY